MTYQTDCTLPDELLEQIADQGLDVLPKLIRTVINTAMQIERQLRSRPQQPTWTVRRLDSSLEHEFQLSDRELNQDLFRSPEGLG
jgi:hypothetical protein